MQFLVNIEMEPVGKDRPRYSAKTGRMYTPSRTANAEKFIAAKILLVTRAHVFDGPVGVTVFAAKKRPQRLCRKKDPSGMIWRTTKPDADNVLKLVCDAITKSGVIKDDAQICSARACSCYSDKGEPGFMWISIRELDTSPFSP